MKKPSDHPTSPCLSAPVVVDPLQYPGWDSLLAAHPQASIFHGTGWARVLQQTYGHTPVYICRFDGQQLAGLLPVMEVSSRWTGRRGVSLPFTDFCPALKARDQDGRALYEAAMDSGRQRRWKYLECRSASDGWVGASPSLAFYGHVIDLAAGVDDLFKRSRQRRPAGHSQSRGGGLAGRFQRQSRRRWRLFTRCIAGRAAVTGCRRNRSDFSGTFSAMSLTRVRDLLQPRG